jgi:C4-dicarboxylate-specific signal transduction histidine kinase
MSELPTPIRDFILTLTDETLSPAYLLLREEGTLLEWGGDLEAYGIKDLKRHMNAGEHIPFLVGLLPLDSSSVFLPHVQVTSDVYADVYLFEREQGVWVLLLDSTADTAKRLHLQQKLYDSRMQVTDLEREGDALYKANAVLEELVRERTAELTNTILRLKQELEERQKVQKKLLEKEARHQAS